MAKCVFIVQGEGKGHMSQSMALKEYLEDEGHTIEMVYIGSSSCESLPKYFTDSFSAKLKSFRSPYFLRTPNRKGILVGRTLIFNLMRSIFYLAEVRQIRKEINRLSPDVVFNFYDIVGALALKKVNPEIKRIGIGHHFYLHLDGYRCNKGSSIHRWLLSWHTSIILGSCDQVLALSFREDKGDSRMEVLPPLIRSNFRQSSYEPQDKYLVYLLNEGFVFYLIRIAREDPSFKADIFTSLSPEISLPSGLNIYPPDEKKFREMMAVCKGLITTSGFDTLAEAAYLGIPMVVIPAQHHFEQCCNGADLERAGLGNMVDQLKPGIQHQVKSYDNSEYRDWVDTIREKIIKVMKE